MAHPKRRQSKTRTAKRRTHEELMIRQLLLLWLFVLIVANGMYITQYVEHVVITEVN